MKWGVVVFPGSNDDDDTLWMLREQLGHDAVPLWHKDADLKGVDAVLLPGGFSYGDYLRCGALARFSPVMQEVSAFAAESGPVIGICNGFQVLCEAGLLPGALRRNRSLMFVCDTTSLRVENGQAGWTQDFKTGELLRLPIKHGEGCYVADEQTLDELDANGQVLFRYVDQDGEPTFAANPNGSMRNIAGVMNEQGNVLGMMPHPEHAVESLLAGGEDGLRLFSSFVHKVSGQ